MKKWFVFYTKSRHEKSVFDLLTKQGFEVFLPMQKVMRQWSDRKKKVEVPLFNSYIFVKETEDRIPMILQTPGVAWNIRHNDKPAVLHSSEFEMINRFLDSGYFVEAAANFNLKIGDRVRIIDGPLKEMEGYLLKTGTTDRFIVFLDSFAASIQVEVNINLLQKVS